MEVHTRLVEKTMDLADEARFMLREGKRKRLKSARPDKTLMALGYSGSARRARPFTEIQRYDYAMNTLGINGLVGAWNPADPLAQKDPTDPCRLYVPLSKFSDFKALTTPKWPSLCCTGDYDMGDVLKKSSGTKYAYAPGLNEEVAGSQAAALNEMMGLDPGSPELNRIQHGAQRGFTAHLGENPDDAKVHKVAEPALEVAMISGDSVFSLENALDYALFYASKGAAPQTLLSDDRLAHYGWSLKD